MRTLQQNLLIAWLALAVLVLTMASGTIQNIIETSVRSSHAIAAEAAAEATVKASFHPNDYYPSWVSEENGQSMIPRWDNVHW